MHGHRIDSTSGRKKPMEDDPFKAKKNSQRHVCLQIRCHSTGLKHTSQQNPRIHGTKTPITMAHHPEAHSSEISVVAVPSA